MLDLHDWTTFRPKEQIAILLAKTQHKQNENCKSISKAIRDETFEIRRESQHFRFVTNTGPVGGSHPNFVESRLGRC